jgi:hypothetical protein
MENSVLESLPDNLAFVMIVVSSLSWEKIEAQYFEENQMFIVIQSNLKISAIFVDSWEEL